MSTAIVRAALAALGVLAGSAPAWAQDAPLLSVCNGPTRAPACTALRGDRGEGWLAQSRGEVMAQHGVVATSQPLAAQAGLQIMRAGGNAIDAAVATAAVLSVVEPMNVGVAGDLFAIVYVAKEKKTYTLNEAGISTSAYIRFREGLVEKIGGWVKFLNLSVSGIPRCLWAWQEDRKSTRLNSSHSQQSRMPSSA